MTDELPSISHSRLKNWRRCHKLHDYKYNQKLVPIKKVRPLFMGTMLHELIEARLLQDDTLYNSRLDGFRKDYDNQFLEEKEEFGDLPEQAHQLVERYFEYYKDDGIEYLGVEQEIIIPFDEYRFKAILDGVVRQDGQMWLFERKSHKNIPDEMIRLTDQQTMIYLWIYELMYDVKLTGVIWDYIRTKAPAIPQILKNGSISMRKNIDTDYKTYLNFLKEHNQDIGPYATLLESLKARDKRFFLRVKRKRPNDDAMQNMIGDLHTTALTIVHQGERQVDRNMTRDCPRCQYFNLCQTEFRGGDSEDIRQREFTIKGEDDATGSQEDFVDNGED